MISLFIVIKNINIIVFVYFSDDSDHLIFSNRSFTYVALGQFQEALVDADAAIKLKPDWPKVSIYYTNCTFF